MRYIVFCSNCNFTGSEEETKISSLPKCPECKKILRYTGVTQDDWRAKSKEEKNILKDKWKSEPSKLDKSMDEIIKRNASHLLTSGYNFEGYKIISYNGIVSGEVVMGTGFLSEFSASLDDFLGSTSEAFSDKIVKAKEISLSKMITASCARGGNAIIGVDFDYTTFANNMIAVSANGTSVVIEKTKEL